MREILTLEINKIHTSSTNPRQGIHFEEFQTFKESIAKHGLLQPIGVMRYPATEGEYEILFGHRRFRACKELGLEHIKATIFTPENEEQVTAIQLIENWHREPLNPIDTANSIRSLIKDENYKIKELAEKLSCSEKHVYEHLKLLKLNQVTQEAVRQGVLNFPKAVIIARLDNAEARNSIAEVAIEQKLSFEKIRELTRGSLLALGSAPFDTDDASLLPQAGSCTDCEKRCNKQTRLFDDLDDDRCNDPICFDHKKSIHFERLMKKCEEKGYEVADEIPGPEYLDISQKFLDTEVEKCELINSKVKDLMDERDEVLAVIDGARKKPRLFVKRKAFFKNHEGQGLNRNAFLPGEPDKDREMAKQATQKFNERFFSEVKKLSKKEENSLTLLQMVAMILQETHGFSCNFYTDGKSTEEWIESAESLSEIAILFINLVINNLNEIVTFSEGKISIEKNHELYLCLNIANFPIDEITTSVNEDLLSG